MAKKTIKKSASLYADIIASDPTDTHLNDILDAWDRWHASGKSFPEYRNLENAIEKAREKSTVVRKERYKPA